VTSCRRWRGVSVLGVSGVLLATLAAQPSFAEERLAAGRAETQASGGTVLAEVSTAKLRGAEPASKPSEPAEEKIAAAPGARTVTKRARRVPPLAPPSDAQVQALERFAAEAAQYEEGARDYRSTLTLVVRHHYEEQRRRILEALDQEIHEGQRQVKESREDAILRLEQFVAKYSGKNADPRATPDAMFRLAALYEERARSDQDVNLATGLEPAMALYRKIMEAFPSYEELAGVAYYLGHAYTDAGRMDMGQQAWRSLVCKNRYPVQGEADDPTKITVAALAQDHEEQFWTNWYNRNPIPLDQLPEGQRNLAAGGIGQVAK